MRCNCRDIQAMLQRVSLQVDAIAQITGVGDLDDRDLPAEIPNLHDDEKTEIETIPALLGQLYEQLDAVLGMYPVEMTIEDADPLTPGDQEEEVSIPNMTEFLSEIYALCVEILNGVTITTAAIPGVATELIAIKNAAISADAYARCNSGYLGYEGAIVQKEVPHAFDTEVEEGADKTLSHLLRSTTGVVLLPTETGKDTALASLAEIKANTDMLTAVNTRKPSQVADLIDSISAMYRVFRGLPALDESGREVEDDRLKELLRVINESGFYKTTPTAPRPKAKKISETEIERAKEGTDTWES